LLYFDAKLVAPLKSLTALLEGFVALPPLLSTETLSFLGTTWWVSSQKAKQELGYTYRSIEEGMAETVSHEATLLHREPTAVQTRLLLIVAALTVLLSVILIRQRRKQI
jgi:hypothetical protein